MNAGSQPGPGSAAAQSPRATALLAEDEPLLAAALQRELARAWASLQVLATVGDGAAAVYGALSLRPDVLFFDIKMPGMSGLDAAAELADRWNDGPAASAAPKPFPLLVFVTAYDDYAVAAFEAHAIDYVLKPVQPARLHKTVAKLQQALQQRPENPAAVQAPVDQLRALLAAAAPPAGQVEPLTVIQASVGNRIRLLAIEDVIAFDAADKYLRVLTRDAEYLIRTPLKDLVPRLSAQAFWQVHRGTMVRATAVDSVLRDESGRLTLTLHGRDDKFAVSRLYAHLFKAM